MQWASNLRTQSGMISVAAVLLIASSWAGGLPASAAEPAEVVFLSGKAAALLQIQNQPAQPVLVAGAGREVVAIVFHPNRETAEALPETLFSTDPVASCVAEGPVACCDTSSGLMVLNVTYHGQNGWLQMGELCAPPMAIARGGVEFVHVPEEVSLELNNDFEVNSCFMELAGEGGEPLVLVNAPSPDHPLSILCYSYLADADGPLPTLVQGLAPGGVDSLRSSMLRRAPLRADLRIMPAVHVIDPPPPPKTQGSRPAGCMTETNVKTCSKKVAHWYKYNQTTALWVYQTTACGPCP